MLRDDLESGGSHIRLVFIIYLIAFRVGRRSYLVKSELSLRVGRARNEPTTMKTGSQAAKQIKTSLRKSAVSDVTSVVTTKPSIKKQNIF